MTFRGTKLALSSPTKGTVTGMLTARGVTKQETFSVTFDKPPLTSVGQTINVVCNSTINRRDYGMKSFSLIVGKNVDIRLEAQLLPS